MNFRDLQDRVLDASGSKPTADRQTAKDVTNEAYYEIITTARLNQATATLPLVADQWEYSFTDDFDLPSIAGIRAISMTGRLYDQAMPLDVTRLRGIGATADRVYALRGLDTLLIHPTPALGDEILFEYTLSPDALSDDEDEPDGVPVQFHDAIWLLGAAKACLRSREDRFWQRAPAYQQQYSKRLGELRAFIDGWGAPGSSVLPRPFHTPIRLAPDQDPVHP